MQSSSKTPTYAAGESFLIGSFAVALAVLGDPHLEALLSHYWWSTALLVGVPPIIRALMAYIERQGSALASLPVAGYSPTQTVNSIIERTTEIMNPVTDDAMAVVKACVSALTTGSGNATFDPVTFEAAGKEITLQGNIAVGIKDAPSAPAPATTANEAAAPFKIHG